MAPRKHSVPKGCQLIAESLHIHLPPPHIDHDLQDLQGFTAENVHLPAPLLHLYQSPTQWKCLLNWRTGAVKYGLHNRIQNTSYLFLWPLSLLSVLHQTYKDQKQTALLCCHCRRQTDSMLPAVVKLCCGISYPHLRSMTGLQRTAVAVIGQELTHLQRRGQIQHHTRTPAGLMYNETTLENVSVREDDLFYLQQAQEAMSKALSMLKDEDGWKVEITESNGDVICSKMMPGTKKVFRLEAVLEASMDNLYDLLFVRVEEMQQWNPSIKHIKVLKRVGPQTVVTHEISAETTGNLIGQRDFLSVRHSCRQKSSLFLGGAAIHLESFPPQAGYVRAEDGPTCIIIQALDEDPRKSRFTWLLNMDLKGWLPKSIVDQALPRAQLDFIRHLRRRLAESSALG